MKVEYERWWDKKMLTVPVEVYLELPNGSIEEKIYRLQVLVTKLLSLAVENKQLTLQDAGWLVHDSNDSSAKLIED